MKVIKLRVAFKDKRGKIIDLVQNENISAVTLLTFAKGAIRANHYHKRTFQWNYLLEGKVRIVTQMPGCKSRKMVMTKGDCILTIPNESHAIESLQDSLLLVMTKGPRSGQNYESDTYRLDIPLLGSVKKQLNKKTSKN